MHSGTHIATESPCSTYVHGCVPQISALHRSAPEYASKDESQHLSAKRDKLRGGGRRAKARAKILAASSGPAAAAVTGGEATASSAAHCAEDGDVVGEVGG